MTSRFLVRAAVYAALYAALTLAPGLNPLAYGPGQFRVSEVLMVFACFDPAAVAGLAVGCAIANLGSPMMPVDIVFGALLTLAAGAAMYKIGPRVVALAVPTATEEKENSVTKSGSRPLLGHNQRKFTERFNPCGSFPPNEPRECASAQIDI